LTRGSQGAGSATIHLTERDNSKAEKERLSYLQRLAGVLAEWKNGLVVNSCRNAQSINPQGYGFTSPELSKK
jgi:hypothetical protein